MLNIRPEHAADAAGIRDVHIAAFPTGAEARLVDALRSNRNASVSLVAVLEERIVGHVLFSPVSIEPKISSVRGVGLAPVAVRPAYQRQGIGAHLIEQGIDQCRRVAFDFMVVLGQPRYYRRFSCRRAFSAGLTNEYGMDEAFMVLELQPGSLRGIRGLVRYGAEFSMLET